MMIRVSSSLDANLAARANTSSEVVRSGSKEAAMLELQHAEVGMEACSAMMDAVTDHGANRLDLSFCRIGALAELPEALPHTFAYLHDHIEHLTVRLGTDNLPPWIGDFHKLVSLTAQGIDQGVFDARQLSGSRSLETLYIDAPNAQLSIVLAGNGISVRSSGLSEHKMYVWHYKDAGEMQARGVVGNFYLTSTHGSLDTRNLNCATSFQNKMRITCRHIALYDALGRYQYMKSKPGRESAAGFAAAPNWAAGRAQQIGSVQMLAEAINTAIEARFMELIKKSPNPYEVSHSMWGRFIRSHLEGMALRQARHFYVVTPSHVLHLTLYVKPLDNDGQRAHVAMLFDPNFTFRDRKIIETDLSRMDGWRMTDFVDEESMPFYYENSDRTLRSSVTLFLEIPDPWLDKGDPCIDIFSDLPRERVMTSMLSPADEHDAIRTYYRAVMGLPLRAHLQEMLERCNGDRPEEYRQIAAQTPRGVPALFVAMEYGDPDSVCALLDALARHGPDVSQLRNFLMARSESGLPGLFMALQHGNAATVTAFLSALRNFPLGKSELVEVLAAKDLAGTPGLHMALQEGNAAAVEAYAMALSSFALGKDELVALLAARDRRDIPGLLMALQENRADTVSAYLSALRLLALDKSDLVELLVARSPFIPSGLFFAIDARCADAVKVFLAMLPTFGLDRSQLLELLTVKDAEGRTALIRAQQGGRQEAVEILRMALGALGLEEA
ncbi:ShET2 enterotoxin, N-terminal region [Cupriavidus sp. YR651]|uniref:ShET2/EspL2 family type III secretion system effector toxin n=1 Tax=Cupriavidus sp. YR651 TaxID=1855315 RepID=UPI000884FD61|nr:ShET2/EspL2 family type III secretion system effector toxin [Cupriavidus sp. YR651]SDD37850.1 ShET2 enterotoxin, N-terminal region [Cupriavidus sp. YR651]